MNHIVFCINETWAMPAGILIQSILHYNPGMDVTFHIITKAFSEKKQQELYSVLPDSGTAKITFHFADESSLSHLPIRKNDHVTIETYFRFLIPSLLPEDIHTALYLDCDMLCTGSISELFETDISGYSVGMCPDTRYSDIEVFNRLDYPMEYGYYCAGTILMNLDWWREHKAAEQCVAFLTENPGLCLWHDQDAINKVLHETILQLDFRYNIQQRFYFIFDYLKNKFSTKNIHLFLVNKKYWSTITSALEDIRIIHFSGTEKPWHKHCNKKPFTRLWLLFCNNSPWKHNNYLRNSLPVKWKIKQLYKRIKGTPNYVYADDAFAYENKLLTEYK